MDDTKPTAAMDLDFPVFTEQKESVTITSLDITDPTAVMDLDFPVSTEHKESVTITSLDITNLESTTPSNSLEYYISLVQIGSRSPLKPKSIFDYGLNHRSPLLSKDRINRILVYPGSFNPPHFGHKELLHHGFHKSGRDLNLIAAIVLCSSDETLKDKFEGKPITARFTWAQRVKLWKGWGPCNWLWIYDLEDVDWSNFQTDLTRAVTEDGFQLEWIRLAGPDHFERLHPPPTWLWGGYNDIIISNAGRCAGFTHSETDSLIKIEGCSNWEAPPLDFSVLKTSAEEECAWLFGGLSLLRPDIFRYLLSEDSGCIDQMAENLVQAAVEENKSIHICHLTDQIGSTIRFIRARSTFKGDISSTKIRGVMARNVSREELLKWLRGLVSYPEILLHFVEENRKRGFKVYGKYRK